MAHPIAATVKTNIIGVSINPITDIGKNHHLLYTQKTHNE